MTFAELLINADKVRELDSAFSSLTDNQIQALKYDNAISELRQDLGAALNILVSDTDTYDLYADKYQITITLGLMYLQLYYFYYSTTLDEESSNYMRMLEMRRRYDTIKATFRMFKLDTVITSKAVRLQRG